jgi:uracil-DNA glycosylase
MQVDYYIGSIKVTWTTLTLAEYLTNCVPDGWEDLFEAADDVIPEISEKLQQLSKSHIIYPPMSMVFNAFETLRPEEVKVVIIGQDPYINQGEAMGLSFSVASGKIPPSLANLYKELTAEGYKGYSNRKTGDLTVWADRGVFLYNVCLTVNAGSSGSHGKLWEDFTTMVLGFLNSQDAIAWILLGAPAQKLATRINREHGVFKAGHPSPLNRKGDFKGSGVFRKTEDYLKKHSRSFTWDLD